MQIFTFYRLQPGADVEAFKEFSRNIDQPACRAKPVCQRFEVYIGANGTGDDPRPIVIEDVEATSLQEWDAATSAPDHAQVMAQWRKFADPDPLVTIECELISLVARTRAGD